MSGAVNRSLAAQLTAREMARVSRETTKRIGHNPERTKSEYLAELWVTARELYPLKVS